VVTSDEEASMRPVLLTASALLLLLASAALRASGPVGIYCIVERVVFEPGEQAPERVQVWGAFSLADGGLDQPLTTSAPVRGYLYFRMPAAAPGAGSSSHQTLIRREWNDLKTVAGTGQAVGFGEWMYVGRFDDPNRGGQARFFENVFDPATGRVRGVPVDLRVRAASQPPSAPIAYQTNAGVVKLAAGGSHAAIVSQLRAALAK
jgi:hypothetical protein